MKTSLRYLAWVLLFSSALNAAAATRYVDLESPNPTPPYSTWATAATNIQIAIDAAVPGDTVLVTNGVYRTGGKVVSGVTNEAQFPNVPGTDLSSGSFTNRLAITKAIIVQSVNGATVTVVEGNNLRPNFVRCAFLTNGAILNGFTLTNGDAGAGGGAWCVSTNALLLDCVISACQSAQGGVFSGTLNKCNLLNNRATLAGGGSLASTLNNCLLIDNFVGGAGGGSGGGAAFCVLNSCTIVSNAASAGGGGAYNCTLNNSIVYYNSAGFSDLGPNYYSSTLNYCCTATLPTNGVGTITNEPGFLNPTDSNLRLQPNSACINAGNNSSASALVTDFDGNPRIAGGTVDIGAYEIQSPSSVLSYAWAQQFGLPTDGTADFADADADGMNNYGEWRSDTVPTNALSVLRIKSVTNDASSAVVTWQSVATRKYWLERATNLGAGSPFQTVATNILGVAGTVTNTDTTATNGGPYFYRVGVE